MNVALDVADLEASSRFYGEAIGLLLREASAADVGAGRVAVDEKGRPKLSLRSATGAPSAGLELGLDVDDLERAHARAVQAGASVVHPPRDEPLGRTARYRDPDGHVVALTERRVEPVRLEAVLRWALVAAALGLASYLAWVIWGLSLLDG